MDLIGFLLIFICLGQAFICFTIKWEMSKLLVFVRFDISIVDKFIGHVYSYINHHNATRTHSYLTFSSADLISVI